MGLDIFQSIADLFLAELGIFPKQDHFGGEFFIVIAVVVFHERV
jgi:hypothetical protein